MVTTYRNYSNNLISVNVHIHYHVQGLYSLTCYTGLIYVELVLKKFYLFNQKLHNNSNGNICTILKMSVCQNVVMESKNY